MDVKLLSGGGGFGDHLCTLSLFCDIPEPINLYVTDRDETYNKLSEIARVLCISEDKLKIIHSQEQGNVGGNLHLKIFCNYMKPERVRVHGELLKIKNNKRRKRYIGFCFYNGTDIYLDSNYDLIRGSKYNEGNNSNRAPECRWRSLDYYMTIVKLVRSWGYDIITFDDPHNLESKVRMLVENCDAVIGYEGGIAHLCHVLQIPYIMFDYRRPNKDMTYGEYMAEMLHQSEHMYLLKSDAELMNFDSERFGQLIEKLKFGKGNNRIVNGDVILKSKNGPTSPIQFYNKAGALLFQSEQGPMVTDAASEIIKTFYPHRFLNLNND